jgi:hypothetical protein
LAIKAGLAPSVLNRLIHGKQKWNLEHLIAVAKVLNVNPWRLVKEAEKLQ